MLLELAPQQIERAHRRHDEGSRDRSAAHVVGVLPPRPRIQDEVPEARELYRAVGCFEVPDGMLHPCVGRNDEKP